MVKWFHADKGYGFLKREDGSGDVFCHLTAVQASGHDTLARGAAVACEIVQSDRGPQVSQILPVEPPTPEPRPGGPQPVCRRPLIRTRKATHSRPPSRSCRVPYSACPAAPPRTPTIEAGALPGATGGSGRIDWA